VKSFLQFYKNSSNTAPFILGKMGVNPDTLPAGQEQARVIQVQQAIKNKSSPYTGRMRPNKLGKPRV